ncbi:scavenger receptor cysteine-rich type 1 protein M160-like isoform X2 [Hyla sarda]|uniref:scavenger receptor cysteine-rich type 1 protein M160-like isoform X2 n=1 Tax=Hyla sarda TaxID=327740 RepID=UPI0024C360DA|nr:scavenger receptor cysteine-rich type 1 protein M160-like isoform X2 [Hyla sarda]
MELALPPSWYVCLWLSSLAVNAASELRSTLVTLRNESLVENEETCQGIVLLFINETTHLVCDSQWNPQSPLAHVVCKESGCGVPNSTWTLMYSLKNSYEAVQGVQCKGNESSVKECENGGEAVSVCNPQKSIAVVSCKQNVSDLTDVNSWRLSRGRTSCDGHVEAFTGDRWSPVCFDNIKKTEAPLLCQQMGCTPQSPVFSPLNKVRSSVEPVTIHCLENGSSLWECDSNALQTCPSGLTTYLQCNRSRMEESWLVWLTICLAVIMILVFCWIRVVKSWKCCTQCFHKNRLYLFCKKSLPPHGTRRNIYHREPPDVNVQETNSPPSSPGIIQDPSEVNALLAPHGFRLNNTITPPPSYMHALRVLSRPLENTQTPPPSYLEALKILSRPILVHVNATECNEEKEDLDVLTPKEKEEDS